MKYAIEVSGLSKNYEKIQALKKISLKIKENECFGLFGPNGAGKSTVISILTTLIPPTSGNAKISGFDLAKEKQKIKSIISAAFQEPTLDDELTGIENLELYAALKNSKNSFEDILDLIELNERIDDLVKTYSYGMKRRLEIGRCLSVDAKIIFLDEPTRSLDADIRKKILKHLLNAKKNATIFIATHSVHEAKFLCDRIGIMDKGNLIKICDAKNLEKNVNEILGKTFEEDYFD